MDSCFADPRPLAAETLRRAIRETFQLGFVDVSKSLETLLARINEQPGSTLRIEVCSGRVLIDGDPAALSNRELELCFALATHHRPVPGDMLAELIYPALELEPALNRVKVYVHRVREKIASGFILCDRDGYRFKEGVNIDIFEFEEMVHRLERRAFLTAEDRQALSGILDRLHGRRNAPVWRWEWFAPIEQRIAAISSRVVGVLAADAFERNATDDLLDLAGRVLQNDPCNEQAREIAIKAHLAAGRHTEAVAQLKHYEAALARELNAEPSAHLRRLLQTAPF